MTILLVLLMSLQVTEQDGHEYIGMLMVLVVIVHQYLNRKWYGNIFRGRYGAVRVLTLAVNVSLIVAFTLSAVSGMMIAETVTFMNVDELTEWARTTHLASSYWSFVLMGLHAGLHFGMIAGRVRAKWPSVLGVAFAGFGLYRFVVMNIADYLVLKTQFAFIDYDRNYLLVLVENIAMLAFWVFAGYEAGKIAGVFHSRRWKMLMRPAVMLACACVVCAVLVMFFGGGEEF